MTNASAQQPETSQASRKPGRREQVLRALKQSGGPADIATLAERLGVHANTVRFHLEALCRTGRVERVAATPTGPGRPAALYRAVPGMDPAGPTQYRTLARILAEDIADGPQPRARAIAAGRRWGAVHAEEMRSSAPTSDRDMTSGSRETADDGDGTALPAHVPELMELLEDLDFDPEFGPAEHPGAVGLRHCPFLDLVAEYPGVICAIHLGLMQGALQAWDSRTEVDDLVPFARLDLCVAQLQQGT